MNSTLLAFAVPLALVVACSTFETPVPVATTTSANVPVTTQVFAGPLEPLRGVVRVATGGIVEMRSDVDPKVHARAVHVRLNLRNDTSQSWTFDVREQRIIIAGGESAAAFSASSAGNEPPVLTIPGASSRVVDLFYTLPPELQNARTIPPFDVVAWLDTSDGVLVERVPFTKLERASYTGALAWTPPYEYNLFHESFAFEGSVDLSRRLVGRPMTIRPEPNVGIGVTPREAR